MKSDIGNLYEYIQKEADRSKFELSFLSREWSDIEKWKAVARSKIYELLHYDPEGCSLDSRTVSVSEREGYRQEEIEFNTSRHVRIQGTLLIPTQGKAPFPCVIAMHSHDGFYYFGREKILESENEPSILSQLKQRYGGRSWASCLARRGYAVFTIDSYYFGSRRLDLSTVSEEMLRRCPFKLEPGMLETDYIRTYNQSCGFFEQLMIRHILAAGLTWTGIMLHDDRRSIDYVLTRPEIDPNRIGCCGLSVGGFRSVYLAGMDSRIKCASATGFMVSYGSGLFNRFRDHTFMVYIPGLYKYMDMPDVAGLAVPTPLLIQQCGRDQLFTVEGMKSAENKLKQIYERVGSSDKIVCTWYDVPHSYNIEMQEESFAWFDKWLKGKGAS